MKILMLTHRLPFAPNRGDRIRAYHVLRHLRGFADAHVLSLVHDDEEAAAAGECPAASVRMVPVRPWRSRLAAVAALPTRRPLTHVLLDGRGLEAEFDRAVRELRPDLVLAYCSGMAKLVDRLPPSIPFVLDMVDVDSVKWRQLSVRTRPPLSWVYAREARCLGAFERSIVARAATTLVVNERERDVLAGQGARGAVAVIPNGIDLKAFVPPGPPAASPSVVFCGVMNYQPNEEGCVWLAEAIWPLVRARCPGARLTLVGAHPTERVRRLSASDPSIVVTGAVPDVRPYLWDAAVSVAPLLTARGLQNKVLEALAARLPVVTTSAVFEGLPPEARPGCRRADTAEGAADALVDLLAAPPAGRRAVADSARLEPLGWDSQLTPLASLLHRALHQALEGVA